MKRVGDTPTHATRVCSNETGAPWPPERAFAPNLRQNSLPSWGLCIAKRSYSPRSSRPRYDITLFVLLLLRLASNVNSLRHRYHPRHSSSGLVHSAIPVVALPIRSSVNRSAMGPETASVTDHCRRHRREHAQPSTVAQERTSHSTTNTQCAPS